MLRTYLPHILKCSCPNDLGRRWGEEGDGKQLLVLRAESLWVLGILSSEKGIWTGRKDHVKLGRKDLTPPSDVGCSPALASWVSGPEELFTGNKGSLEGWEGAPCGKAKAAPASPTTSHPVVAVQLPSCVRPFATPCAAARQASLSLTISQSFPSSCPLSR